MKPQRGDIWYISFEPQVGKEIKKSRPGLVVGARILENLPIVIVLPIREYKEFHKDKFFFVPLEPSPNNNLKKLSTVDCVQIKSFSQERFIRKIGSIGKPDMQHITDALRLCLELF